MKLAGLFVLVCLGVASAQFVAKPVVPVLSRTEVRDDAGQFSLSYLTGDGISHVERGVLKPNAERTGHVLVKEGRVSYTTPEGKPITLSYVADENGFRPEGAHLPVAPPVPVPTF